MYLINTHYISPAATYLSSPYPHHDLYNNLNYISYHHTLSKHLLSFSFFLNRFPLQHHHHHHHYTTLLTIITIRQHYIFLSLTVFHLHHPNNTTPSHHSHYHHQLTTTPYTTTLSPITIPSSAVKTRKDLPFQEQ